MSGDVAVFLLEKDGQLLKLINFLVHDGPSGVVPDRQEKPHPHCSIANYDNKAVFVSDLGTDYVYWYDFDAENSNIKVNQ
jgi:6-phosphogluconolactonase